jgi:uncharacterized protein GlcG (DUF336 family)
MKKTLVFMTIICSLLGITQALAEEKQPTVVDIKRMSLDVALQLANAAIEQCRKEGVQVAVTVVDRGGHPQVVLRDVLAQDLTLTISRMKAYTAMSFNMATSAMEGRFTSPFSIGKVDGIVIAAGGVPVTASGNIIGGVGVSGAPSGETDEKCAKAGVDAISDELEMATM